MEQLEWLYGWHRERREKLSTNWDQGKKQGKHYEIILA